MNSFLFKLLSTNLLEVYLVFRFLIEQIRNEAGEDFLDLLKEWDCICRKYGKYVEKGLRSKLDTEADEAKKSKLNQESSCEYEVARLIDICYGDPSDTGKRGIYFKVNFSCSCLSNRVA